MFFSLLGVFLITAILLATICVVGRITLGP
jgi:hypothetical protein